MNFPSRQSISTNIQLGLLKNRDYAHTLQMTIKKSISNIHT